MELAQQKVHEGSAEDSGKDIMAADKLHDTLQNKQVTFTNATDELACIARKSLCYKFLSPMGTQSQSETKHPLWAQLAEDIEAPPLTALNSAWILGGDHPMSGLSTIFCDYRQELATNFSNLWTGSLYTKALDFLLRFTLRFNLAPDRELRYFTRLQDNAEKKILLRETSGKESLSHKQWKDRTEKLEQELWDCYWHGAAQEPGMVEDVSRPDRSFLGEEARLLLEVTEEALDEIDKEAEEEQQQASPTAQDPSRPKEPSRNHLKTLQAITKILLESPELDVQRLNPTWVRRTAHKPEELTDVECLAVVRIVKALSPYTPKRVKNSSGGTSSPTPNPASMIKVVLLSNHILRYTGYSQFTKRFAPAPSVASLHPVPLGAAALYDALCWKAPGHFDIHDANGKPISSVTIATKNKEDTFANFFDMESIHKMCSKYKLKFGFRQHTVVTKNRFELLAAVDKLEECKSSEEQQQAAIKLPPVHHITAPQISDLAFTTKTQRRRERRLAADTPEADAARSALGALTSTSINAVSTLEDVDHAQNTRRACRQPCRDFENTRWRTHDLQTGETQTKRVYATLASMQREKVKDAVLDELKKSADLERCLQVPINSGETKDVGAEDSIGGKRSKGLVKQKKDIAVVVLHGAAGTAVGSRTKGHTKRGGSKLTQQHRKHGPVGHTNENRTSRVCSCCFVPVSLSRASRTKDGYTKTVRLNGAVECKNPVCLRRRAGSGSMGRDTNAASNMPYPEPPSSSRPTTPPFLHIDPSVSQL
ncbi:MAG: hypothetical protein J3R72DRAFT_428373 [Linnemannia gamsii]|nr:MAG: hypothetical protein J3R72DRAFT_428373 [Linnemannia gamsii]